MTDPAPKFLYQHDGDRIMAMVEALAEKFEDLEDRVRVLEINAPYEPDPFEESDIYDDFKEEDGYV